MLNNVAIQYLADTGAGISVISEEVAKILNIEIKSYDRTKIKAVTADGKEVKDILGFAELDATIDNQTLEKVKMLVFKNASNPCLVGRDVLAVHPVTKANFEALINNTATVQPSDKDLNDERREYLRTGKTHKCTNAGRNIVTEAVMMTVTRWRTSRMTIQTLKVVGPKTNQESTKTQLTQKFPSIWTGKCAHQNKQFDRKTNIDN